MRYSDRQVLEDISRGDDRMALTRLYDNLFPVVLRQIVKLGGDEDEAKDLFQDAIMTFYNKVVQGEFNTDYKISTFVTHITQKKWYTRFQKKQRMEGYSPEVEYTMEGVGTYEYVFDNERKDFIAKAFSSLGEQCSKILEMVIYHKYNMKEIAKELGYANENSAKTKHYRCKQRLAEKLKGNKEFELLLRD